MLELQKFIKDHEDWEELLTKAPYFIKINRDGDYIIFKYDQSANSEVEHYFKNPIVRECRGLILDTGYKAVCVPFFKFMNAEEPDSDLNAIDWASASVQQKIDGSLIKLFFDRGKWRIATNGTIDAFKADLPSDVNAKHKNYGELFLDEIGKIPTIGSFELLCRYLDSGCTYMFELITDENRVVVPASNYSSGVYLLGCRDNATFEEKDLSKTPFSSLIAMPKRYDMHSYDDVKKVADELPWDQEGFVVCDRYFHRVKIKSPAYVKAHFARNNGVMTYERLMDIILSGEKSEFLTYSPDYAKALEKVEQARDSALGLVAKAAAELKSKSYASRKDFASDVLKYPSWMQPFLFKHDALDAYISRLTAANWVKILKTKGDLN